MNEFEMNALLIVLLCCATGNHSPISTLIIGGVLIGLNYEGVISSAKRIAAGLRQLRSTFAAPTAPIAVAPEEKSPK
jgi:hypothetical protein